jgi:hypothetical protein
MLHVFSLAVVKSISVPLSTQTPPFNNMQHVSEYQVSSRLIFTDLIQLDEKPSWNTKTVAFLDLEKYD